MITMTVIESISFRARRRGIIAIQTWKYCSEWQRRVGQNTTRVMEIPPLSRGLPFPVVCINHLY
jgi:hypothetical protein